MIIAVQYSCKKSTAPTPPPTTADKNTVALTSGPWKRSLWEVKKQDGTWLSLALTDYQKSVLETYNSDYTYVGEAASNLGGTTTFHGTWKFANHETTIVMFPATAPGSPDSTSYSVISATALQEKEVDWKFSLPPELTGSATDTLFYGWRFTWSH
jgi:hypothetical protein